MAGSLLALSCAALPCPSSPACDLTLLTHWTSAKTNPRLPACAFGFPVLAVPRGIPAATAASFPTFFVARGGEVNRSWKRSPSRKEPSEGSRPIHVPGGANGFQAPTKANQIKSLTGTVNSNQDGKNTHGLIKTKSKATEW